MELTLLAPTALSAACSKALAFWAAAGPTAGPSMRADTATNVTSTFLISLLPKSLKDRKFARRLSQVTADLCMPIGAHGLSALPCSGAPARAARVTAGYQIDDLYAV